MRSRLVQAAAFLLVSFGLFMAVAAFLYHYNNKYENTMVYPMGGVVFLDEGTLNQDKPLFLAHQWNCYPDKQYTPEDFEKGVWKTAVILRWDPMLISAMEIRKGRLREAALTD